MINQLLLDELFSSPLCIDARYMQSLATSAWLAFNQKEKLNFGSIKSYTVHPKSGMNQPDKETPPGSVGIVVLEGPIVSNSDWWYDIKGTIETGQELLALDADPNIIGTVLVLESGGGAVYAIKPIADIMNSLEKPVVTYAKTILASAAYRIAANTDYIMMYHPKGIVGSLGTMSSFSDMQPMLEKWGMKFFEYYATESSLKNKTYTDARNGDGKALIKNVLDPMNDEFISDIKSLRGNKLSSKNPAIYQGETFLADQNGLSLGLIDAIGNLSEAIAMVQSIANGDTKSSMNSNFKSNNPMWFKNDNKLGSLTALAGVAAAGITAAQVEAVNKEIVAEKIEGVTLVLDSEMQAAADQISEATAALTAINAALGTGNEKATLAEAVTALVAINTSNATALTTAQNSAKEWEQKAVKFGAQPAATTTGGKQEGSDPIQQSNPDQATSTYCQADADLAELRAANGIKPKVAKQAAK